MNVSPQDRLSHELMTPLHQILGMAQLIHLEEEKDEIDEYYSDLMAAGEELRSKLSVLIRSSGSVELERILGEVKK